MTIKPAPRRYIWIVFLALLVACGTLPTGQEANTPISTVTRTLVTTPKPSLTPIHPSITPITTVSLTNTTTATLESSTPLGCIVVDKDEKLYVLSDDTFFAWGPSTEELDQALENNYPEWANYEQNVPWTTEPVTVGKIVREASFQEEFALNSEVTLVTLGESLDWQLPPDSDLFSQSLTIGERLHHLWFEWTNPENEQIRTQFPEVANAATYALYVFFDYDTKKLERISKMVDFGPNSRWERTDGSQRRTMGSGRTFTSESGTPRRWQGTSESG